MRYIFICLLLFISGCSLLTKPPAEPGLEELSSKEIRSLAWNDDLDFEGLLPAALQSIRYYKQLPRSTRFHYNKRSYSPDEMAASLMMFLDITGGYHGEELNRELREKFLFFESINSDNKSFFTGYYEPVIDGSLEPAERFQTPLYPIPADLIKVDLGLFDEKWQNENIYGRIVDNRLVPYYSREEIAYENSLWDVANPIAYADEIEVFFLQIQGSGLLRLPDGRLKRLNYASTNGLPYSSIGKLLKDKIPEDKISLQSIKEYLYSHPDEVREILSHNGRYVFFREVAEGPMGYIEVPLTPHRSIAMDKKVTPAGSLAYIETELPVFTDGVRTGGRKVNRFVLVQDTGGAIVDHGRVDIFLGHDNDADLIAGNLKDNGRSFLIIGRKEFLGKYLESK